ncbi:MAG: hypothetical protein JWN30_2619 [Bacilli bacterium]|nr:hypothetical protein [Bacilli bacterium]
MVRLWNSIRVKLLLSHLLIAFLVLVISGSTFFTFLRNYTIDNAYQGLLQQDRILRDSFIDDRLDPNRQLIFRIARINAVSEFYLVNVKSGGMFVEQTNDTSMQGQPFMLQLGNTFAGEEYPRGIGQLAGRSILYVAVPVQKGRLSQRVIVLTTDAYQVDRITKEIFFVLLRGFLLTVAVILIIVFILVRQLVKPIHTMGAAVKRVALRDFNPTPIIRTNDEWEQLSRAFHQMVESLRQYNEGQRRFLQHASHELKTPLMSIQGYAEGIRDGLFQGDEINEGLEIISSESIRLKKIVDELIYLSKLETLDDIYNPQQVDLGELIPDILARIGSLTKQKGLSVNVTQLDHAVVVIDRDKLTQAIVNLLSNAVRYALNEVGISVIKQADRTLIQVWDDGAGIDETDRDRIFERFYHGHKGDTGLGLAITRAIVEKSEGRIEASNRLPAGALFQISLPHRRRANNEGS